MTLYNYESLTYLCFMLLRYTLEAISLKGFNDRNSQLVEVKYISRACNSLGNSMLILFMYVSLFGITTAYL